MDQQSFSAEGLYALQLWIGLHYPWLLQQKKFLRGMFFIMEEEVKRILEEERKAWESKVKRVCSQ